MLISTGNVFGKQSKRVFAEFLTTSWWVLVCERAELEVGQIVRKVLVLAVWCKFKMVEFRLLVFSPFCRGLLGVLVLKRNIDLVAAFRPTVERGGVNWGQERA